jgi:hypothetical protein
MTEQAKMKRYQAAKAEARTGEGVELSIAGLLRVKYII